MTDITGTNGTWDYSIIGTPPEMLRVAFFPNPGTCKDVRLSQRVSKTAWDAQGRLVTDNPAEMFKPGQNPFAHAKDDIIDHVLTGGSTPPTYIDHVACNGDPYYNGDDPMDRASAGDATAQPPTLTKMDDSPGGPMAGVRDTIVRIDMEFETCAICAESGEIFGCIRWMCRVTRDNQGKIAILTKDHDVPASSAFQAAFHAFVSRHTKTDSDGALRFWCPDGPVKVGGSIVEPWRGTVPDGFRKRWLESRTPEFALEPALVGGGDRFASAREALRACIETPEHSAIKVT